MYYIVVYDINQERVNKVHKLLRQYLFWVQNSVFEGELKLSEYKELVSKLNRIIDINEDYIVFYKLKSKSNVDVEEIGSKKSTMDMIF
jgi:CRISPR-associated protein Cas2